VADPLHVQANPVVVGADAQHRVRPAVALRALAVQVAEVQVVAAVRVVVMLPVQDRATRKSHWVENRSRVVRRCGNC